MSVEHPRDSKKDLFDSHWILVGPSILPSELRRTEEWTGMTDHGSVKSVNSSVNSPAGYHHNSMIAPQSRYLRDYTWITNSHHTGTKRGNWPRTATKVRACTRVVPSDPSSNMSDINTAHNDSGTCTLFHKHTVSPGAKQVIPVTMCFPSSDYRQLPYQSCTHSTNTRCMAPVRGCLSSSPASQQRLGTLQSGTDYQLSAYPIKTLTPEAVLSAVLSNTFISTVRKPEVVYSSSTILSSRIMPTICTSISPTRTVSVAPANRVYGIQSDNYNTTTGSPPCSSVLSTVSPTTCTITLSTSVPHTLTSATSQDIGTINTVGTIITYSDACTDKTLTTAPDTCPSHVSPLISKEIIPNIHASFLGQASMGSTTFSTSVNNFTSLKSPTRLLTPEVTSLPESDSSVDNERTAHVSVKLANNLSEQNWVGKNNGIYFPSFQTIDKIYTGSRSMRVKLSRITDQTPALKTTRRTLVLEKFFKEVERGKSIGMSEARCKSHLGKQKCLVRKLDFTTNMTRPCFPNLSSQISCFSVAPSVTSRDATLYDSEHNNCQLARSLVHLNKQPIDSSLAPPGSHDSDTDSSNGDDYLGTDVPDTCIKTKISQDDINNPDNDPNSLALDVKCHTDTKRIKVIERCSKTFSPMKTRSRSSSRCTRSQQNKIEYAKHYKKHPCCWSSPSPANLHNDKQPSQKEDEHVKRNLERRYAAKRSSQNTVHHVKRKLKRVSKNKQLSKMYDKEVKRKRGRPAIHVSKKTLTTGVYCDKIRRRSSYLERIDLDKDRQPVRVAEKQREGRKKGRPPKATTQLSAVCAVSHSRISLRSSCHFELMQLPQSKLDKKEKASLNSLQKNMTNSGLVSKTVCHKIPVKRKVGRPPKCKEKLCSMLSVSSNGKVRRSDVDSQEMCLKRQEKHQQKAPKSKRSKRRSAKVRAIIVSPADSLDVSIQQITEPDDSPDVKQASQTPVPLQNYMYRHDRTADNCDEIHRATGSCETGSEQSKKFQRLIVELLGDISSDNDSTSDVDDNLSSISESLSMVPKSENMKSDTYHSYNTIENDCYSYPHSVNNKISKAELQHTYDEKTNLNFLKRKKYSSFIPVKQCSAHNTSVVSLTQAPATKLKSKQTKCTCIAKSMLMSGKFGWGKNKEGNADNSPESASLAHSMILQQQTLEIVQAALRKKQDRLQLINSVQKPTTKILHHTEETEHDSVSQKCVRLTDRVARVQSGSFTCDDGSIFNFQSGVCAPALEPKPEIDALDVCHFCGETVSDWLISVAEHMKLKHPHRCHSCQTVFMDKDSLLNHRLDVHRKQMHDCATCDKLFSSEYGYKRHARGYLHMAMVRGQMKVANMFKDCFAPQKGNDLYVKTDSKESHVKKPDILARRQHIQYHLHTNEELRDILHEFKEQAVDVRQDIRAAEEETVTVTSPTEVVNAMSIESLSETDMLLPDLNQEITEKERREGSRLLRMLSAGGVSVDSPKAAEYHNDPYLLDLDMWNTSQYEASCSLPLSQRGQNHDIVDERLWTTRPATQDLSEVLSLSLGLLNTDSNFENYDTSSVFGDSGIGLCSYGMFSDDASLLSNMHDALNSASKTGPLVLPPIENKLNSKVVTTTQSPNSLGPSEEVGLLIKDIENDMFFCTDGRRTPQD